MAGAFHHHVGKSGSQSVQAGWHVIERHDDRELGAGVSTERWIRIECHHFMQDTGDCLLWRIPEIREQPLLNAAIRAGNAPPVRLTVRAIIRLESGQECSSFSRRDLLSIADRIYQYQSCYTLGELAGIGERDCATHAMAYEHKSFELQRVGDCAHISSNGSDGVVAILRLIGPAVPAELDRYRTAHLAQILELPGPVAGIAGQRVNQHHRQSSSGTAVISQQCSGGAGNAHRTHRSRPVEIIATMGDAAAGSAGTPYTSVRAHRAGSRCSSGTRPRFRLR